MNCLIVVTLFLLVALNLQAQAVDRVIREEVIVDAGVNEVWKAWTTEEGVQTFFAPACNIEFCVDGLYEMFFVPDAEPGQRGSEGMRIMALQPEKMLAFMWNAPPSMPNVRKQRTHVVVRFKQIAAEKTKVNLTHDGWGEGEEWDQAFEYFSNAWKDVVLPRLKYRFSVGPVNWENPPRLK